MTESHGFATLFQRSARNPILCAKDWPAHAVFNPGATRLRDGTTLLLCRVEDRRGLSHLCAARSAKARWLDRRRRPTFLPDPKRYPEELWGIEDPRITYVHEHDREEFVAQTKDESPARACGRAS
jgi:predicted GH43/DUF377 family glycosyl hydrolase